MHLPIRKLALIPLVFAATLAAQQPRTTVLIDPAHGGPDTGAHLASALEKDQTLAFALRLRTILAAAGDNVLLTRDADPTALIPTDQRAELANQRRPTATIILHLTPAGTGIHIVASALPPADELADPHVIPWDTAQSTALAASLRLANQIGLALEHQNLPVTLARASLRPLDNITTPAIAVEIAPLPDPATDPVDAAYQQRVAQAIASGLATWRTRELHIAAAAAAPAKTTPPEAKP